MIENASKLLLRYQPISSFSRDFLSKTSKKNPILILHGMLGSSQNWTQLGKIVHQKTKRNVFLLDARNHGKSPHSGDMTYLHMASDLKQFCADKSISKATIVGHSMGARTAMTLSLVEPDLVEKLVSVDASPIHKTTPEGIKQIRLLLDAVRKTELQKHFKNEQNFAAAKSKIESDLLSLGVKQTSIRQWLLLNLSIEADRRLNWAFNLDVLSEAFEPHLTLVPTQLSSRSGYNGDTLFIGGEKSSYIPRESHQDIRRLFPKANFSYVPNAGHWVHADNPDAFLSTLLAFLGPDKSR